MIHKTLLFYKLKFLFTIIIIFNTLIFCDEKIKVEVPKHVYFEDLYSGEKAKLSIPIKNLSSEEVFIENVKTSCGCTTAKVNKKRILPYAKFELPVIMSTSGKSGFLSKSVRIYFQGKRIPLRVRVGGNILKVPEKHMKMQGHIFKGKCKKCHVDPATGKHGEQLYLGACAICHGVFKRGGQSAPSLEKISFKENELETIIKKGKGISMPGFSLENEGPLDKEQIKGLVNYLLKGSGNKASTLSSINYKKYCATCHGVNKNGGMGPSLTKDSLQNFSKLELYKILNEGVKGTVMVSFNLKKGGPFNERQIEDLVKYLKEE